MERYFDRIANDALVMEKWKRVEELKEMGIKPFGERFDKKNMIGDILSHTPEEELTFKTAGRIMAYRGKGKTALGIPGAVLVRLTGLEPAAFRVGAERSIQAELQTHMYENRPCRTGFSYLILVVKQ